MSSRCKHKFFGVDRFSLAINGFGVMLQRSNFRSICVQIPSLCTKSLDLHIALESKGNCSDTDSKSETEWKKLLKPYGLVELQKSLNKITPSQLNKLLELPQHPWRYSSGQYYGYVTNGRLDEAKAVPNESMSNIGCDPDVYTYNVLIRGLCKKGCMASAREVVIESPMKGANQEAFKLVDDMVFRGCNLDDITYNGLMKALCKDGVVEKAMGLLEEIVMLQRSNFRSICVQIPSLCTKSLDLHIALESKGNCSDTDSKSETEWKKLLKPYGLVELQKSLNKITPSQLNKLLELPQHPWRYSSGQYYGYVTNGRLDEAKAVPNESMSNIGCDPDVYTYNVLIRGLCKKGCMASAREVVIESPMKGANQEAFKLVDDMVFRGCNLDDITYNGLMKALCKDGVVEKAMGLLEEMYNWEDIKCEFLRDMIHRGLTPDIVTHNSLINGLCKLGHLREAHNLFDNLQLEGISPDAITYNTLICSHCKAGMFDDAYVLVNRGIAGGFIPNDVTWYILVNNFVKEGDV
ncbi:unnamed protein product [Ilex paraguariensis]|uniref:Pentatricopeptide repeat-containing protein n=1 Tax=Ilex paraguariensis TaxID=185542 RepID=A0ABC8SI10_9AQUA